MRFFDYYCSQITKKLRSITECASIYKVLRVPLAYLRMNLEKQKARKGEKTMNLNLVNEIGKSQLRTDIPEFRSGSTVRVHVKIKEGDKSRVQVYEGIVTERKGGGIGETFTVRKISNGVGVERKFPLHSPIIDKIEVVRHGKVRRNKLRYLRNRSGKSARLKEIRH